MSFKEKNTIISLVNFSLILAFYLTKVYHMIQRDTFTSMNVFRLWGIVIFMATIVTVALIILTHLVPIIFRRSKSEKRKKRFNDLEDERDQLIDLKGTKITYTVSSLGSFVAMLAFVFGQSPLVMFTMLIFFGVLAQILGDAARLILYRRDS